MLGSNGQWRRLLTTGAVMGLAASLVAGAPANAGSRVSQALVADFTYVCNPILELRYCVFDGRTSTGDITNWDWDFGDGSTGSGETTAKIYATAGTRDVTLTVTGSGGGTDSVTKPVKVP